jgi:hypothetical protein
MYWAFVPDGFVAMGTAAMYAETSYFYLAFDVSLLDEAVQFDDRIDRLGYAIGLFGASVSPLASARYFGQESEAMLPFVIWFVGVITFLIFVSNARLQEHPRR